jgi:quercetin dioxygenase-like cupin family protein
LCALLAISDSLNTKVSFPRYVIFLWKGKGVRRKLGLEGEAAHFYFPKGRIMQATSRFFMAAILLVALPAAAQTGSLGRTDLLKKDIGVPGREAVQVRVDFPPGVNAARHSHPGEEIAYVLQGTLQYQIDGQPPVTLKAGQALFIPAGAIHSAKNVDAGESRELATYIVEKGKPIVVPAK